MEDGLRDGETHTHEFAGFNTVLILVVMEDGLRGVNDLDRIEFLCLNPCCYGRWSQRGEIGVSWIEDDSLNPCCYGRWSQSESGEIEFDPMEVLILVVMEDGLRDPDKVVIVQEVSQS